MSDSCQLAKKKNLDRIFWNLVVLFSFLFFIYTYLKDMSISQFYRPILSLGKLLSPPKLSMMLFILLGAQPRFALLLTALINQSVFLKHVTYPLCPPWPPLLRKRS